MTVSNRTFLWNLLFLILAESGAAELPGLAVPTMLLPQNVHFAPPNAQGLQTAVLAGDPNLPMLYTMRIRIPAGVVLPPHHHSEHRRHATILQGTLYYSFGDYLDPDRLQPLPPGSFVTEPDSLNHFAWAKDGDVVLDVSAEGPIGTTWVPESQDFVDIHTVAPSIALDIRYATPHNFTGQTVYPVARCLIRHAVADKLTAVQAALQLQGMSLKIFDCYRPVAVQRRFWSLMPDERYVANPAVGSRHNRGAAVDVTLIDATTGKDLEMPTDYDDFSEKAHRDYAALPAQVIANRTRLQEVMEQHGFVGLPTEWWHFDATNWQVFPICDIPITPEL